MISFYSQNIRYEIESVSESFHSNSILFLITKTIYAEKECKNAISQRRFERRLRVDENGNVYISRNSDRKWFNLINKKIFCHYSLI